jgi:hypothetical protein
MEGLELCPPYWQLEPHEGKGSGKVRTVSGLQRPPSAHGWASSGPQLHLRIRHAAILYTIDTILCGDNNNNTEIKITTTILSTITITMTTIIMN